MATHSIGVPPNVFTRLEAYRNRLATHLGFKPSLGDTIAFALRFGPIGEEALSVNRQCEGKSDGG